MVIIAPSGRVYSASIILLIFYRDAISAFLQRYIPAITDCHAYPGDMQTSIHNGTDSQRSVKEKDRPSNFTILKTSRPAVLSCRGGAERPAIPHRRLPGGPTGPHGAKAI